MTPSSSGGWGPITALARLAGRVLEAPVRFVHPEREYSNLRKAVSLLPGRRAGHRALLLIAAWLMSRVRPASHVAAPRD